MWCFPLWAVGPTTRSLVLVSHSWYSPAKLIVTFWHIVLFVVTDDTEIIRRSETSVTIHKSTWRQNSPVFAICETSGTFRRSPCAVSKAVSKETLRLLGMSLLLARAAPSNHNYSGILTANLRSLKKERAELWALWMLMFSCVVYRSSVRTSQQTQCEEICAVLCENNTKYYNYVQR